MLILERQEKIIEYLKAHKSEKTAALARAMYVSEATVRRDIAEMEKLGLVRRSHGGVVLFENSNDEPSIAIRMNEMEAEKQKIARLALPLLKPFRTLFLDSSSTVSVLAKHFHEQHKTVISTGIQAVTFLSGKENVDVFLPGGFLHYNSNSVEGAMTVRQLENYNFDATVCSCGGVTEDGVTEATMNQCIIKNTVMAHAGTNILLADHTKIGNVCAFKICRLADFDVIVTDEAPSAAFADFCRANDIALVY